MKKLLFFIYFLLGYLFLSTNIVFAQQGCCSWHGGIAYCDSSTNRYVCNDKTYSPTCTCGSGYVPQPSCPSMSYYDSLSSSCKCYAGYVSNGSSCISNLQNCWNKYGYNSTYDYASQSCGCSYGYTWNDAGNSCISKDQSCHNKLGIMSRYNSLSNTCDCFSGYTIQGGQCQIEPKTIPVYENNEVIIITTNTPKPTVKPTSVPTLQIKQIEPTKLPSHLIQQSPTVIPTSILTPTPIQDVKGVYNSNKKPDNFWGWLFNLFSWI